MLGYVIGWLHGRPIKVDNLQLVKIDIMDGTGLSDHYPADLGGDDVFLTLMAIDLPCGAPRRTAMIEVPHLGQN